MGVDLVLEGFQFGLCFGDVELFDAGFVVFFFEIEKKDLVDIGDEAGGDDDEEYGVDEGAVTGILFVRKGFPGIERDRGQQAGIDDIGEEQRDDDLVVGVERPLEFPTDEIHQKDIALPDDEGDENEEGVAGEQLGPGVKIVGNETGEIGNGETERRDSDGLHHPVVQSAFIIIHYGRFGVVPIR